ncbi:hypothetical protein CKAN_01732400 [Cinnamomum micranthum f. kanehirae]|uniref:Uncharacterized protein n=1 Tax=Cinnamomum micranthum f. kanehirae TaxID=337451 RepID=A0A443PC27_9MAGN|nr:hypothetical protein CKAN_01732400 [Cinnamomum micranthum f. kanehirae]
MSTKPKERRSPFCCKPASVKGIGLSRLNIDLLGSREKTSVISGINEAAKALLSTHIRKERHIRSSFIKSN